MPTKTVIDLRDKALKFDASCHAGVCIAGWDTYSMNLHL